MQLVQIADNERQVIRYEIENLAESGVLEGMDSIRVGPSGALKLRALGVVRESVIPVDILGEMKESEFVQHGFSRLRVFLWDGQTPYGSLSVDPAARSTSTHFFLEDPTFLLKGLGSIEGEEGEACLVTIPEAYLVAIALVSEALARFMIVSPMGDRQELIGFRDFQRMAREGTVESAEPPFPEGPEMVVGP